MIDVVHCGPFCYGLRDGSAKSYGCRIADLDNYGEGHGRVRAVPRLEDYSSMTNLNSTQWRLYSKASSPVN